MSAEEPLPDQPALTADALLAAPRGRTLCVSLLDARMPTQHWRARGPWVAAVEYARRGEPELCVRKLAECTAIAGLPGAPFDGGDLLAGLAATIGFATYWAKPDTEDLGFADEAVREALRPVAEAVAAAVRRPAAGALDVRWWTGSVDRGGQRYAQFFDQPALSRPPLTGAARAAGDWLAGVLADERSATARAHDRAARPTGQWQSSPVLSRLPVTTRALPALGAARLALVENRRSVWPAHCWPVTPRGGARVFEIGGPDQWAELVERYPLDVSRSRRHNWGLVTGWHGRWLIPDYAAAAADWDGVHVSVASYLTTAGTAIPVGAGARTMLAGWDPDATWWLTDVLSSTGQAETWRPADRTPVGWIQAT